MVNFPQNCRLRPAGPADAVALSTLAFRSKASWGYDIEFMKRCRDELTYTPEQLMSPRYRFEVCTIDDEIVAFYGLALQSETGAELEALFVKPEHIRKGLGRLLAESAKSAARELGIRSLTIQGDPNAEDFYLSLGAESAGYRESASIPGRYLPVFRLSLVEGEN